MLGIILLPRSRFWSNDFTVLCSVFFLLSQLLLLLLFLLNHTIHLLLIGLA